jgi:hypothetical protein
MFTVGYGDILPKNVVEIMLIILVQLFGILSLNIGIILIGYIVSEIGHTLTTIRQNQE